MKLTISQPVQEFFPTLAYTRSMFFGRDWIEVAPSNIRCNTFERMGFTIMVKYSWLRMNTPAIAVILMLFWQTILIMLGWCASSQRFRVEMVSRIILFICGRQLQWQRTMCWWWWRNFDPCSGQWRVECVKRSGRGVKVGEKKRFEANMEVKYGGNMEGKT